MIVLDSSAVLALLFEEEEHVARVIGALSQTGKAIMSAGNVLECVLRLAPTPTENRADRLDAFLDLRKVEIIAIDVAQLHLARAGFIAYGKGRHPAGLNFGDCFAYALAKNRDAPLLFVGGDFAKTDVKRAI